MKTRYPLLTLAAVTVTMSSLPASAGTWRSSAAAGANWTDANNGSPNNPEINICGRMPADLMRESSRELN